MRRDLSGRTDVHDLVVAFYRDLVLDDVLEPVFVGAAEVDWAEHIPKLIDYWCRVLFGEPGYAGAILGPHRQVHEVEPFRPEMFDRWYALWGVAIDAGWEGPNADRAKEHAARIASMLSRRLTGRTWNPPERRDLPHRLEPVFRRFEFGR